MSGEYMSERTDDQLVRSCQQGNKTDFNEIVYRYKNSLYQYILALVKDDGAAGDIFQEVFWSFYRHIGAYKPQGKLKSYLFTSARNRILNYFRDKDKAVSLDDTDEEGNAYLHQQIAGKDVSPLEGLTQAEGLERIQKASMLLPEKQREVVYLKQLMTFQEMAEFLGRPLGTVLADYHRGIRKIQQFLQEEDL